MKYSTWMVAIVSVVVLVAFANGQPATTQPTKVRLTTPQVASHLQAISVTIRAESRTRQGSQGSGIITTRRAEVGGKETTVNWVMTAAHVVESLRTVEEIIDGKTGTKRQIVRFADAAIVQEMQERGRRVGEMRMAARVFRYNRKVDLALLQIRKTGFVRDSVRFYLDKPIPALGTDLNHVGSMGGQALGANSMTGGIIAQIGRVIDGQEFDQTDCAASPGSSGGGVFLKGDGRCIGILTRGVRGADNFNFIVPIRRVRKWARRAGVLWAIDPSVPVPSQAVRERLPIEESGTNFGDEAKPNSVDIETRTLVVPLPPTALPRINPSEKREVRNARKTDHGREAASPTRKPTRTPTTR